MDTDSGPSTHSSLLSRLRRVPVDQAAWEAFVDRYVQTIYEWARTLARSHRLPESDVEEVTANVLGRLVRKLRRFRYDPTKSFRGWLRTVTKHALRDLAKTHRRWRGSRSSGDTDIWAILLTVEARKDLQAALRESFDLELYDEALARIQGRVPPEMWHAFTLTAKEGLSGAEAARRLGTSVVTVYKRKSRVLDLLKKEV